MLLSQVINSVAYFRTDNILSTLIESSSQVKEILKNDAKELDDEENKFLFGTSFEDKLIKDSKALKKSETIFTGLKQTTLTHHQGQSASNSGILLKGPSVSWRRQRANRLLYAAKQR